VVCGQLCGEGHANMIGTLEVIPPSDFDTWAKEKSEAALKAHEQSLPEQASASID